MIQGYGNPETRRAMGTDGEKPWTVIARGFDRELVVVERHRDQPRARAAADALFRRSDVNTVSCSDHGEITGEESR